MSTASEGPTRHPATNCLQVLIWHRNWPEYVEALRSKPVGQKLELYGAYPNELPDPQALASAECLLSSSPPPGALHAMPSLKWVQTVTVGIDDWIARDDLRPEVGIVCARGVHRVQMPENILGALFYAAKPFGRAHELQKGCEWDDKLVSAPLSGATLCIVGTGAIGSELARKARQLEMRVIGVNRTGHTADHFERTFPIIALDSALAESDYVVLLVPATPETENLMNAGRFASMRPGSWLMNFARGAVVVDADLIAAVRTGHLAGAVLDAFRDEPLPRDHPFWAESRILVLPHMGGKHPTRDRIVAEIFAENIEQFLSGAEMSRLVDRRRGY